MFEDVFGHRAIYLTATAGGRLVGVLPLVRFRSLLFGRFLVIDRDHIAAAYLAGAGIEIGALHNPLRVTRAARVRYVDNVTAEEARRRFEDVRDAALVPVDILDDGTLDQDADLLAETLSEFFASRGCGTVTITPVGTGALALDSGARRGELAALRWSDLDMSSGRLTIAHGEHADKGPDDEAFSGTLLVRGKTLLELTRTGSASTPRRTSSASSAATTPSRTNARAGAATSTRSRKAIRAPPCTALAAAGRCAGDHRTLKVDKREGGSS